MTLTPNQLQCLLTAYQNTHTPTKSFGTYDPDVDVLRQWGLIAPQDAGTVGTRITEKGDALVQAALQATGTAD